HCCCMGRILHPNLKTLVVGYFSLLALFALWIALNPSDFWLFFGGFLFSIGMAYIAMIRFSKDLQESTSKQIMTLREEMGKQLEHLASLTRVHAEEVDRLTPRVSIRIDEHPYLLWMKDYWVCANLSVPVSQVGVKARVVRRGAGKIGTWVEQVQKEPPSLMEIKLAKLGDLGIRGIYDSAEVLLHIVTKDT